MLLNSSNLLISKCVFICIQRIGDVSKEIKRVRAQMEEDEQLASLMRGLRGQSLNDSLFAEDDVQLRLVEVLNNLFAAYSDKHLCISCFYNKR
jgi:hypothetical protein